MRLVEGDFTHISCLECRGKPCDRANQCRTISMWKNLQNMIDGYFDSITLKDLMNDTSNGLNGIDLSFLDASL